MVRTRLVFAKTVTYMPVVDEQFIATVNVMKNLGQYPAVWIDPLQLTVHA